MIRACVREWEAVPLDQVGGRSGADALLRVARAAQDQLRLGGEEGERILLNGVRQLRAQQVVGVLAAPGVTLEILPKIDAVDESAASTRTSLIRMIARTLELDIADGELTQLATQGEDLLEVLVRLFCERVFALAREGLPRSYTAAEADLTALRGRLDVRRQFTRLVASPAKLACAFDELTPDVLINQIVKAALVLLSRRSRSLANRRRIAELLLIFHDVECLPRSQLGWRRLSLDRSNQRWSSVIALAQLLLGNEFQTTGSGERAGFALLFEMNRLFEAYIGASLQKALRGTEFNVTLQKPLGCALDENGRGRFRTVPDIVVHRGRRPVLIVDTKWKRLVGDIEGGKRGVAQSDVYQMMAYAQVYNADGAMLLYPHHRGLGPGPSICLEFGITNTERRLSVTSISLADLGDLENNLRSLVLSRVAPGC